MEDVIYWSVREIKVGKRLPYFTWHVWAVLAVFAISVGVGLAIGVDSNNVLHEAIIRK